jgi:hypothetical protein
LEAEAEAAGALALGSTSDAAGELDSVAPPVVDDELQAASSNGTHSAALILTAVLRPAGEATLLLIVDPSGSVPPPNAKGLGCPEV